jgi:hypothetical protein
MAKLNLPPTTYVTAWGLLKDRLSDDQVLKDSKLKLEFFEGPGSITDLGDLNANAVRFYPFVGAHAWYTEQTMRCNLQVGVEAVLVEVDPEDVLNLNAAIVSALYPDDGGTFQQALIQQGRATTGLWSFPQPLNQPMSEAGKNHQLRLRGVLQLELETGTLPT